MTSTEKLAPTASAADEDEQLRRALALSLVTEREDKQRREQWLRQEEALLATVKRRSESPTMAPGTGLGIAPGVRRVTSLPYSSSLPDIQNAVQGEESKDKVPENIVRPRPQPGQSLRSRSPSPHPESLPPPRPDHPPKRAWSERTSSLMPPRPHQLPQRPVNVPSSIQSCGSAAGGQSSLRQPEKALISLSPPRSSASSVDFDLSTLDPLNSPTREASSSDADFGDLVSAFDADPGALSKAYAATTTLVTSSFTTTQSPKPNYFPYFSQPGGAASSGQQPFSPNVTISGSGIPNYEALRPYTASRVPAVANNHYMPLDVGFRNQTAGVGSVQVPQYGRQPSGNFNGQNGGYTALRQQQQPTDLFGSTPFNAFGTAVSGTPTSWPASQTTVTNPIPIPSHLNIQNQSVVDGLPSTSSSGALPVDASPSADEGTYMSLLTSTHTDISREGRTRIADGDLIELGGIYDTVNDDYLSLEMFDPLYEGSSKQEDLQSLVISPQKAPPAGALQREPSAVEVFDPFSLVTLEQQKEVMMRKKNDPLPPTPTEAEGVVRRNTPKRLSRIQSLRGEAVTVPVEKVTELTDSTEDEIKAFCQMASRLKAKYPHTDKKHNVGLVISPLLETPPKIDMSVKLTVKAKKRDVAFTCDLNSSVTHVISYVLMNTTDDVDSVSTDDYILQVQGLSEYLANDSQLGKYEYVQNCLKLDQEIRFTLLDARKCKRPLLRTAHDDKERILVPKHREMDDNSLRVTKDQVNILMDIFYKEVDKVRDQALQRESNQVRCEGVIQAVKAIQAKLSKIETVDLDKAVRRLRACGAPSVPMVAASPDAGSPGRDFVFVTVEDASLMENRESPMKKSPEKQANSQVQLDDLYSALEELTGAVKTMVQLYSRTFHADFQFESTIGGKRDKKEVTGLMENLIVHIASLHRIPAKWKSTYENYKVMVGLYHGAHRLCEEVTIQSNSRWSESFHDSLFWDEWVQFDVLLGTLPREARLIFTVIGVKTVKSDSSDQKQRVNTAMCWVALQLFNFKFELVQGSQLLGLWPGDGRDPMCPIGTSLSNTESPNSVLLQVNMPEFDCDVTFPPVPEGGPSQKQDFSSLHPNDQEGIKEVVERDFLTKLTKEESEVLWEKRLFLTSLPAALPIMLQSVNSWDWGSLMGIYPIINQWKPLPPLQAMMLLLPHFPDTHVRSKAVEWLRALSSDELVDYLPHLVQALKFESYHNSALAGFLLESSIKSVRVAHHLYWLLKEAADDFMYRKRYQLMFGALMSLVGTAMRDAFSKQEDLTRMLGSVAEKVKAAKDREAVLHRELDIMWEFLRYDSIRLPLNPSMEVSGVDIKSCSYYTSFTWPLKLVLHNVDPQAESIYTMFKAGDDLRQDMLTMQLIRIMDKLWLKEGLDLRIITFRCQPTSIKKGLVELITEAETLRKIQVKYGHGIAGSFKDRTIAQWLQAQNPTELEYEKAVDNFTASCAGYCVATYVLGICDRHNDNIMVKQSGHMFHIDFGKFLGDAQMFGNIKRDRVPFVLTSDMAYVINGSHKASARFQQFVDLCCQGFNILRRHANLLITLFLLMSRSGIPGVTEGAARYVQKALLPQHTNAEATAIFTRMIEESLKSLSTQINFFFHNLAQMKFSGHNEGALLSFIPKTYSMQTDGKIVSIELYGFQKRYNPEKYYIYIIKVVRDNQKVDSYIFRKYSEFCELQSKLVSMYPLAKVPSLGANRPLLGRTHVKTVADQRKVELEKFLYRLFTLPPEISESDIVYTFFHPILRDEQDMDKTNLQKLKEPPAPRRQSVSIEGQVKLSLHYKNDTLTVMIMHVKDLTTQNREAPDPYVKLYLLPDKNKVTKRKTKIAHGTFHPTYNEMLLYRMPIEEVKEKVLQVTVWNYDSLSENEFLGAVHLSLREIDLSKETSNWYHLQNMHQLSLV